jgi:gamma-glutamyltranspeptidase/glutathione hydrolase
LDAPRVEIGGGLAEGNINLEEGITELVRQQLEGRGHKNPNIVSGWARGNFGTGQIIVRDSVSGVLVGGSDPRNDGMAIGW